MIVKVNGIPDKEMLSTISGLNCVVSAERFGNDIDVTIDGDNSVCVEFFKELGALNIGVYGVNEEDALEATYLRLIKESK
jgi:ABC-2 type transport system ATP-binding protein